MSLLILKLLDLDEVLGSFRQAIPLLIFKKGITSLQVLFIRGASLTVHALEVE